MEHPIPNLAPNDFWLFQTIKCDNDIANYSTTGVPEMFPTVAALLG